MRKCQLSLCKLLKERFRNKKLSTLFRRFSQELKADLERQSDSTGCRRQGISGAVIISQLTTNRLTVGRLLMEQRS